MARKLRASKVEDPDGDAWRADASARWRSAELANPEEPFEAFEAPELPDFRGKSSPAVTRPDVYGRFVQNRDTGVVHDVYAAKPECDVDGIRNATYFHFWVEVVEHVGDDVPCDLCLAS